MQEIEQQGLTRHELRQLKTRKLKAEDMKKKTGEDGSCPICFGEFTSGDQVRDLETCDHLFHKKCIDQWLKLNANCPLCRSNVRDSIDSESQL